VDVVAALDANTSGTSRMHGAFANAEKLDFGILQDQNIVAAVTTEFWHTFVLSSQTITNSIYSL
jgi:hypothetical protein